MTDEERANVKGVLFLASPINGSDQAAVIKTDLKPFISSLIPFIDNFVSSFTADEFMNHFYDTGFPLSNASKTFKAKDAYDSITARNQAFFNTRIPFRCLIEEKKTHMALVGRSYFTVAPKWGTLVDPS